jgi:hypothetical protein
MNVNCSHKNPLIRNGSNQKGRMLAALSPESAKIDERTLGDFLLFARKYAKYVKYYNLENKVDGNWEAFWASDISAILVELAAFPIDDVQQFFLSLQRYLIKQTGETLTPTVEASLVRHFKLLFHLPMALLQLICRQYYLLPLNHELRQQLSFLLEREGKEAIHQYLAYFKGAISEINGLDDAPVNKQIYMPATENIDLPDFILPYLTEGATILGADFQLPFSSGAQAWKAITAVQNSLPFQEEPQTNGKIYDALNYGLFVKAFEQLFQLMQQARQMANRYFEASVNHDDSHTPHYALWLAFLKLFQHNQQHLNTYTERHLTFYFEQVLQLFPKAARGSKAHLIIELNKNIKSHLLKKGTAFKAGKDDEGTPVYYESLEDIVLNQGKVDALKSIFVSKDGFPSALPQVNTLDGIEEPLPEDQLNWKAFGNGPIQANIKARLGFAIADSALFLKDGSRIINLHFTSTGVTTTPRNLTSTLAEEERLIMDDRIVTHNIFSDFDFFYTAEKEWVRVDGGQLAYTGNVLSISLGSDQEAVVPFDPKVHIDDVDHKDVFSNELPVLKAVLKSNYTYWKENSLRLEKIQTGANNVKDFTVQNPEGIVDTSKPFPLFGSRPIEFSSFIIGSRQAFSHELSLFKLHLEYETAYNTSAYFRGNTGRDYDLRLFYLEDGQWKGESSTNESFFYLENDKTKRSIDFSPEITNYKPVFVAGENTPYSLKEKTGYLKLSTDRAFGHKEYPDAKALALIKNARGIETDLPKEPYTPTVVDMSFDYRTKLKEVQQFFHLHPFGIQKRMDHRSLSPAIGYEGTLFIGLKGLQPPQSLSILFQVADGTADPLADPATLEWSYLAIVDGREQWLSVGDQTSLGTFDVDDKTHHFSKSGVVGISCPKTRTDFTVLPEGLHWIRIAVNGNVNAVNDLLSVDAQAVLVGLKENDNTPNLLEQGLEAEVISKLKISEGAIKKITQPYRGFGGRGKEQLPQYFQRVSERLRHKNRAVQIWDYEHLILQQFPDIYKVKCLNHTKVCKVENGLQPGHVTIVVVPKMPATRLGQFQPFASKRVLLEVEQYLRKRISPFVKLQIVQPKLEAIQLEFEVAFNENIADLTFYREKLNAAISRFLAPWAFDDGQELSFGGKWYKADFINFVEEQPYVHYVKAFFMYQKTDLEAPDAAWDKLDVELAVPTTQRTVFIPHSRHIITNIQMNDLGLNNQEIPSVC